MDILTHLWIPQNVLCSPPLDAAQKELGDVPLSCANAEGTLSPPGYSSTFFGHALWLISRTLDD